MMLPSILFYLPRPQLIGRHTPLRSRFIPCSTAPGESYLTAYNLDMYIRIPAYGVLP